MSDTNVHRVVGNLLVGTSHFFVDTTTNRVGVNTSSPSASLDIASGDLKVGSGITLASGGTITATAFDGDGSLLSNINSDSGSWVNGASSNIHLAVSTDNVGIATTTPMTKLDIAYNAAAPAIVFSDTTNSRYQTGIGSLNVSNEGQRLDFYTGDSLTNGTLLTNSPRMCITGTGNVGIGTSSPSHMLHIETPTGTSSNYVRIGSGMNDGSSQSISGIQFHTNPQFFNGDNVQRVPGQIRSGFYDGGSADWTDAYISFLTPNDPSSGNLAHALTVRGGLVGIGVTSPGHVLDIQGSQAYDGSTTLRVLNPASQYGRTQVHLVGRYEASNDAWSAEGARNAIMFKSQTTQNNTITNQWTIQSFPNGTNNDLGFMAGTDNTPKVIFRGDTGRVGIGRTAPTRELDVAGNINLNGSGRTIFFDTTGGSGLYWGGGYSRIVDDGDLRICTDDNMHFNSGCSSSTLGTERMVIKSDGKVGINEATPSNGYLTVHGGGSGGGTRAYTTFFNSSADTVLLIDAGNGNTRAGIECTSRESHSAHGKHAYMMSVGAGSTFNTDLEFRCRDGGSWEHTSTTKQARISYNGRIYARVGTNGTGADYAELFEWEDGNVHEEDRTGMTVRLTQNGKVCVADSNTPPNEIIGVVSVIYGFLGNDHWDEWHGKYVKDHLGRKVMEMVDYVSWDESNIRVSHRVGKIPQGVTVPESAEYFQHSEPKLNSDYDETREYIPREKRTEWVAVGLIGRLRVLKKYPKSNSWIKMQDLDENVEEYLAVGTTDTYDLQADLEEKTYQLISVEARLQALEQKILAAN